MKSIISLFFIVFCVVINAQTTSLSKFGNRESSSQMLKISSKKGTPVEKEIINLSKFKNLNIQKIILKDLSDNSSETSLGIMVEYETFDNISKRTVTIEKPELSKLNQFLQTIEQKENENVVNAKKKFKFVTMNNIEFGTVYKENSKIWINYIIFPSEFYSQSINEFSREELKDLIKLLKNAEQEL